MNGESKTPFAVGYQQNEGGERFADVVRDYRESIGEVYFPWPGMASCRGELGAKSGFIDWGAQGELEEDLVEIRSMGVPLDLLFNANCYGPKSLSQAFEKEIISLLDHLGELVGGPDVVTTTSLMVGRTVKTHFPDIDVRASVNMRIGEIEQMKYVAGLFDSFCLWRDLQRDLDHMRSVKNWCEQNGKKVSILVNSGCLHKCPGQSFHDNLVAHDGEIAAMENVKGLTPHVCWSHYRNRDHFDAFLKASWIRPEDLGRYEGLASIFKLATRMHDHPRMVIDAYVKRSFAGNLLNLMEPDFSAALAPGILDNAKFPEDWFDRYAACRTPGERDAYCQEILKRVLDKPAR